MAVEIREVKSKKELKQFIEFANNLYKDSPYFCPPLFIDELAVFSPKDNPAFDVCESVCYLAYRDGQIVGRIAGIINHAANRHWNSKHVRFGWIDFIDDLEVSKALLDAVAAWGKSKGMEAINGPVGFTDFDHEGLLIEGYEYLAPMASLYNYPYYVRHMEAYGLVKENDWIEYQITPPAEIPERLQRLKAIVEQRANVHVDKVRNVRELKKKYGYTYMDVIDTAYQCLYNFQPLTPRQKQYYAKTYFPLVNFDFVTIVANEKGECVGVGVGMPSLSKALKKCGGKLFPFGWYYVLKALKAKQMEDFDLLLIAVRPDYQAKGVNALFMIDQIPYFNKYGIKRVETTSIMETNWKNQANWQLFEHKQHKRRRAYIKDI